MPTEWGNGGGVQNIADMISPAGSFNVLKVNNVHDGANPGTARIATHTINSGTNATDRALKVEGKTEIIGATSVSGVVTLSGGEGGVGDVEADNTSLWLGTAAASTHVVVGNTGADLRLLGSKIQVHATIGLSVRNQSASLNARAA